jgi:hypothetical protein
MIELGCFVSRARADFSFYRSGGEFRRVRWFRVLCVVVIISCYFPWFLLAWVIYLDSFRSWNLLLPSSRNTGSLCSIPSITSHACSP